VLVDTDAICAAIKDVFQDTRSILEPAGALAIAGMKAYAAREKLKGQTLIAIACGANMNFDRLRFVAERTEVGEAREALFAVTIPEERGSFKRFCELVGQRNVTEFNYRISDAAVAQVFVGISTSSAGDNEKLAKTFRQHGYETVDLTHDDLAAEHVRYMVGGKSARRRRTDLPLRVPGTARGVDEVPDAHAAELEHLDVPLPQIRARIIRACWLGCRCRVTSARRSPAFWPSSAIGTGTKPTTRRTGCSCLSNRNMLRQLLSSSRYVVITAVLGALAASMALFVYGLAETAVAITQAIAKAEVSSKGAKALALEFIEIVDLFLLGTVMLMIALGLYELFIDADLELPDWLQIRSFDDLKHKLIGVVIVVLAVLFLGYVVAWDGQRDLLRPGLAIALVIAALSYFLSTAKGGKG
jgi:uncharacterized membrane protein YqhA